MQRNLERVEGPRCVRHYRSLVAVPVSRIKVGIGHLTSQWWGQVVDRILRHIFTVFPRKGSPNPFSTAVLLWGQNTWELESIFGTCAVHYWKGMKGAVPAVPESVHLLRPAWVHTLDLSLTVSALCLSCTTLSRSRATWPSKPRISRCRNKQINKQTTS